MHRSEFHYARWSYLTPKWNFTSKWNLKPVWVHSGSHVNVLLAGALDHVFDTDIIAYCQQNRYLRLSMYTDLFTLIYFGSIQCIYMHLIWQSKQVWDSQKLNRRLVLVFGFTSFSVLPCWLRKTTDKLLL